MTSTKSSSAGSACSSAAVQSRPTTWSFGRTLPIIIIPKISNLNVYTRSAYGRHSWESNHTLKPHQRPYWSVCVDKDQAPGQLRGGGGGRRVIQSKTSAIFTGIVGKIVSTMRHTVQISPNSLWCTSWLVQYSVYNYYYVLMCFIFLSKFLSLNPLELFWFHPKWQNFSIHVFSF